MKANKIGFKLSAQTFGPDKEPTDVVEIYIDGKKLSDIIRCTFPLWPSELYSSLMRTTLRIQSLANQSLSFHGSNPPMKTKKMPARGSAFFIDVIRFLL